MEYQQSSGIDCSSIALNSWELIARTIESHQGYGLIPDLVLWAGRYPNLIPALSVSVPYTICAIFPKGAKLSYSAQTFLQLLSRSLSQ